MNYRALMDEATAAAIDMPWLARALAPLSAPGARRFREWLPFIPGQEALAQAALDAVVAAAGAIASAALGALRAVLANCPDPLAIAQRAAAGDVLDDIDFFELSRFCDAALALHAHPALPPEVPLASLAPLAQALQAGRRSGGAFYLDESFAPELAAARGALAERTAAFEAARGRLLERVARALERDDLRENEFIIMRAGMRGP